jgi:phosphate-selective porin OprO and OprP
MNGGLRILKRHLLAGASAVGILACGASGANAADADQLEAAIKAMQAQMEAQQAAMQAQIAALQKEVQEAKAEAAAAKASSAKVVPTTAKADPPNANSPKSPDATDVLWKGGAPQFKTANGEFSIKARGGVQTDYESANQDRAITSFPDVAGTEFRRARLGVEGNLWWDYQYVFEVDLANDTTRIKDAYLQYTGLKFGDTPLTFRVGNFKTPNSFEQLTLDYFVDIPSERSAFINAWDIDRQIGFMTAYWTPHFGLAAGIFGQGGSTTQGSTANPPLFAGFTAQQDTTFAARATVAPINNRVGIDSHVLHFGASVRTREVGEDQPLLTYQARCNDLHMTNFCVNTGTPTGIGGIGDGDTFWGLEAAGLWGPFSAQGEYGHLGVDLPSGDFISSTSPAPGHLSTAANPFVGIPNPDYNAWYVQAAWFFGGRQTYDNEGKWARPIIPNPFVWGRGGGWGGLEIVGKYDVINMSDSAFNNAFNANSGFVGGCPTTQLFPGLSSTGSGTTATLAAPKIGQCGDMTTWIIAANWWLNDHVRLAFDYSQSDLGNYPITTITATNTTVPKGTKIAGFDDATTRGFAMRAQVDW